MPSPLHQARHAARLPRSLKQRINRRAYEVAKNGFERYRDELEAAIAEDNVSPDEIEKWLPHDRAIEPDGNGATDKREGK